MRSNSPRARWMIGAAVCAMMSASAPALAAPQTAREAELEARLKMLEAAVADLRTELQNSKQAQQETATQVAATSAATTTTNEKIATLEKRPIAPAEGFRVGNTTVKMGGFVKLSVASSRYSAGEVAVGSIGKEFYVPQQIPVGGVASRDFIAHARQTRLQFSTATPFNGSDLKTLIEFDFGIQTGPAGAQRATNAYQPSFRRGFITYGNFLLGQEWTNFQNPAVLPETTDFAGPIEGTVFVRQAIVQYKAPLREGLDLFVALENPQTSSMTTDLATLVDDDDDAIPDFTAKLAYKGSIGELSLAGVVRQLSIDAAGVGDKAIGWGVSAAGKIPFGPDNRHDVRFMATYGEGIGRYLGLGYVADGVYGGPGAETIETIGNFAAFGAVKLGWTDSVRSTFMAAYQHADYPDVIALPALANRAAWSVAGNVFWSPVKSFDVGVEYRHGVRETVGAGKGQLDRFELAAKYAF